MLTVVVRDHGRIIEQREMPAGQAHYYADSMRQRGYYVQVLAG